MFRFARTAIALLLSLAALASHAAVPTATERKIQDWVLQRTEAGAEAELLVVLKDRADLALAERLPTKEAKGWFVYEALTDTAERTQRPLRAWLEARGITYQAFFIVNALLVKGNRDLALELAERDDVDRIEGNPVIHNVLPPVEQEDTVAPGRVDGPSAPSTVEWNIARSKAPDVWALGYRGQGVVVGGADTGYRWTHAALKGKYRGWDGTTADHNYNWHDAVHSGGGVCGPDSQQPCDDYGHGTHTMGTVLGDDGAGNQVGMAPGAQWIGCRNMDVGNGTPARYLECFQFFLAPTRLDGTGADPSRAPDLTTNSWGCPASEGCSWSTLQQAIDAQRAAGIMTVVSAGNSGPACGSVSDAPAPYASSFAVGATTSTDTVASFSSRGPAVGSGLTKPDVVAPGVGVRSASYGSDTAYTFMSGTSMAAPNVAGGVALLLSAQTCYRRAPDAIADLLRATATRLPSIVEACGGDYVNGPNNTWGSGLLNVLAAVDAGTCQGLPPSVASLSPASGSTEGGTAVTVKGDLFQPGATVTFGGAAASAVVVSEATTLTCTTPPHPVGSVDVAVSNPDGGSGTLRGGYTYASASCQLTCSATVPASGVAGTAVSFQASATPSRCTGSVTYQWSFGDGGSSGDQNPQHTYASAGDFNWSLTTSVQGVTCTAAGSLHVAAPVVPPAIAGVTKATSPFRLKISGANFHTACVVKIGGVAVPATQYKGATLLVAKGGAALKAMVPKGVPVAITVTNTDDGGVSAPFGYTR